MNAVSVPAAMIAALAAAGGQIVQLAPHAHAPETIASFLPVGPASRRGTPQCFGQTQYRPRKTQGVFLRRLPDLPN